ncbi:BJDP [Dione juno nucleopolyhedrovirus]|uniref:BJDP n=1 Tax=Dione juno nucleopolyhedrovirus TaxID=2594175 RepID=A0AAE6H2Z1_9ABAC|nr:BJDP [Dione juno nucleopolyhedrovirus]QDL57054.1 BJDP [Dione juno nucleopolyhedrovirus]
MAAATRSRKRGADKPNDDKDGKMGKRAKQNRVCSLRDNDFLGLCSLSEINYYEALKLDFDSPRSETGGEFALLVAKRANFVTAQVRAYSKVTDLHHNNAVHDVLILIDRARSVIMDDRKRQRYDRILFHKNENVLKICDTFIGQFKQTHTDLTTVLAAFESQLAAFVDKPQNVLSHALTETLENWLAIQPVLPARSTSTNRVLITWVPFPDEQAFTREQTEQLIVENFKIFGDIVNVHVYDIDANTAIVEYKTQAAQREAIERNKSNQVRFSVSEYMLKKFYNSQLRAKMRDNINKIDNQLVEMRQHLTGMQLRYNTT